MWTLLGLPGKEEKREKAKKQEIRRVHNSNPLQRHDVQPSGLLILESKYMLSKNEPRIRNKNSQSSTHTSNTCMFAQHCKGKQTHYI